MRAIGSVTDANSHRDIDDYANSNTELNAEAYSTSAATSNTGSASDTLACGQRMVIIKRAPMLRRNHSSPWRRRAEHVCARAKAC